MADRILDKFYHGRRFVGAGGNQWGVGASCLAQTDGWPMCPSQLLILFLLVTLPFAAVLI